MMAEQHNPFGYTFGPTTTTASASSYTSEAELTDVHTPHPKKWRVGRSVGRTIYVQEGADASKQDTLIGMMDTSAQAMLVVLAVNSFVELQGNSKVEQDLENDDKGYIEFLENRLREKERRIEIMAATEAEMIRIMGDLRIDLEEKTALARRLREELDRRTLPRHHMHYDESADNKRKWRLSDQAEAKIPTVDAPIRYTEKE
jgi:hypothetical protein